MSYSNFIPAVWEAGINRDLERKCVFVEDCYRKYEGTIKRQGESVTITGIGKPTIYDLKSNQKNNEINSAEMVESSSIVMPINQIAYFNYEVGDIDEAQSANGILEALHQETTEALANRVDRYIANLAMGNNVNVLGTAKCVNGVAGTNEKNVLDILDALQESLWMNDVADSTEIVVTVDPKFFTRLRKEYTLNDTNNSKLLMDGKVYYYNNMQIKVTNNVARANENIFGGEKSVSYIMARTKRAICYVNPLTHSEAYRPEKKFSDAVKGFILYDAKVVRPKELFVYKCTY